MKSDSGMKRRDYADAILGAVMDAFIIFLLMLPGTTYPSGMDFYIALRVSLMVFAYSLARNLKLNIHFREFMGFINAKMNGCACNGHRGEKEDDKQA